MDREHLGPSGQAGMSLVERSSLKSLGVGETGEMSFFVFFFGGGAAEPYLWREGCFQGPHQATSAARHSQALGRLVGSLPVLKYLNMHD